MRPYLFLAAVAAASLTFSTAASAAGSMAYCWLNSKHYYRCYGPTQLIFVGERNIAKPLTLSGCTGARRKTDFTRAGIGGGAWFTCQRKLERYHNSPQKIRSWINSQ